MRRIFKREFKGGGWKDLKNDIEVANRGRGGMFDMGVGCFETAIADPTHFHRSKQTIKQFNFSNQLL